jgi:hypothetical protein
MILYRSLKGRFFRNEQKCKSPMITLDRLAAGGFFKNNRQIIVEDHFPSFQRLCRVLRCMNNLETLSLLNWKLSLTQGVPQLLRFCPKLTELRLKLVETQYVEMDEDFESELRPGFERLRLFELNWDSDSWPVIQEILT